jgi:hypothetical protein
MGNRLVVAGVITGLLLCAVPAAAQSNVQLWGNLYLTWLASHRASFGLETEPKVLLAAPEGTAGWWELDLTPSAQYVVAGWMDVTGEFMASYTRQTDGLRTFEFTPRAGARFHLLSRDLPSARKRGPAGRELPPRRRIVIRDYLRLESRNVFYDDGRPSSSTWRVRNRLDAQFPINRDRVTTDGALAAVVDWEFFVPVADPDERFANRQRIRLGLAYRHRREWRFTLLYVGTRTRDTLDEPFSVSSRAVALTVVRTFQ